MHDFEKKTLIIWTSCIQTEQQQMLEGDFWSSKLVLAYYVSVFLYICVCLAVLNAVLELVKKSVHSPGQ